MARVKLIVNKEDVAPEHHALFDELAVCATAREKDCGYIWKAHVPRARKAGVGIVTAILNAFEVAPRRDAEPLPLA